MSYKEIDCHSAESLAANNIFVENPDGFSRFIHRENWFEIVMPEDFVASNDYEFNCREMIDVFGLWPPCQYLIKTLYTVGGDYPKCYKVNADIDAIDEIYNFEDLSLADYIIFDKTESWGIYSSGAGFFSIGGRRDLIEKVVLRFGGLSKVRSKFNDFVEEGGVDREIGMALLSSVKWPP